MEFRDESEGINPCKDENEIPIQRNWSITDIYVPLHWKNVLQPMHGFSFMIFFFGLYALFTYSIGKVIKYYPNRTTKHFCTMYCFSFEYLPGFARIWIIDISCCGFWETRILRKKTHHKCKGLGVQASAMASLALTDLNLSNVFNFRPFWSCSTAI